MFMLCVFFFIVHDVGRFFLLGSIHPASQPGREREVKVQFICREIGNGVSSVICAA